MTGWLIKVKLIGKELAEITMNLAKPGFFSCPIALAALVLVNLSAEARVLTDLSQPDQIAFPSAHDALAVALAPRSDRPLLPTGCSCARCTKAEQLLRDLQLNKVSVHRMG